MIVLKQPLPKLGFKDKTQNSTFDPFKRNININCNPPLDVKEWLKFGDEVVKFISKRKLMCIPDYRKDTKEGIESEFEMYPLLYNNVSHNLNQIEYLKEKQVNLDLGNNGDKTQQDFSCKIRERTLFPIEVKFPNIISKKCEIYDSYKLDETKVKDSVHQLWCYMKNNNHKYGVLTTYERTWFFMQDPNDILYISKQIPYFSTEPSVMGALYYLIDRAIKDGQ